MAFEAAERYQCMGVEQQNCAVLPHLLHKLYFHSNDFLSVCCLLSASDAVATAAGILPQAQSALLINRTNH